MVLHETIQGLLRMFPEGAEPLYSRVRAQEHRRQRATRTGAFSHLRTGGSTRALRVSSAETRAAGLSTSAIAYMLLEVLTLVTPQPALGTLARR